MDLFERANQLHLEKRYDEAEKIYDALLTQNWDNPGLLATLGTLYLQTDRVGLALSLLRRAAQKIEQSDIYCNIGVAYKYSGQYDEARNWFEKAVASNPTAESLTNYAGLHVNTGTPQKALESAQKALQIDNSHAMAHWNMAMAQLELGKWDTAWDEHEWGFAADMRKNRDLRKKPQWEGQPGKICVYGEQGLGDEIMFASMLSELKDHAVIFETHPRLHTLFERSFPEIKCYGTRNKPEVTWDEDFDYRISIGSLGKFFRRSVDSFPGTPYLKAEPAPRGNKFRVGISWTGGLKKGRVAVRAIPLSWWKSILDNDCEFVSLQYTQCEDDLAQMDSLGYSIIRDPAVYEYDYYETAKLVASCDLVISVCTSVIHLAGALGVPTWVMVPNRPAWRYGVSGKMPWYRSVRLYRQPQGDTDAWLPVVQKVGLDLSDLLLQRKVA